MFAIITVRQLPPKESLSNLVSFESLYGIWIDFWFYIPCLACSQRALMQLPRERRDLLMLAPSTRRMPLLLVLLALSEPAKSIKLNLAILISALIPWALSLCSTVIYSTACDLEEASLASVLSFVLALFP